MPGPPAMSPRPADPHLVTLSSLVTALDGRMAGPAVAPAGAPADPVVSGVSLASGQVRPGDLFAAVPGVHRHGADFVPAALDAGAVAVLTDDAGSAALLASDGAPAVPVLVVADARAAAARAAASVYRRPSTRLEIVGVTGTSGKTTTSFLLRAALEAAGRPTGLIGTVGVFAGARELPATLTTPEAPDLQALLAVMVEAGQHSVVMEVSSHALAMNRVDEVQFTLAAFTNLSQDHLDFHRDLEDYFEAKARLFDGRAARHVVVVDDEWGRRLAREGAGAVTVATESGSGADWTARDVEVAGDGSTAFRAVRGALGVAAGCRIPGAYNVANALLALAVAVELGVPPDVAATAIAQAQVPGRMERIDAGQPFLAVVDYSHKPAAVAGALAALRPLTAARLIVVLGCGGDRDRTKRPVMGEVAARDADVLIVTDDNPRSESPAAIRAQMVAGARGVDPARRAELVEIGDRGAAIERAVAMAAPGDTVLIAGKGHETGQDVGGVMHAFDDRVQLRAALQVAAAATPTDASTAP